MSMNSFKTEQPAPDELRTNPGQTATALQIETVEQRRERLAKVVVLARQSKCSPLAIADAIIASDRAAGCDPEALRAKLYIKTDALDAASGAVLRLTGERDEARAEAERHKQSAMHSADWANQAIDDMRAANAERDALAARLAVVTVAAGKICGLLYEEGGSPAWNVSRGHNLDKAAPALRRALFAPPARAAAVARVVEAAVDEVSRYDGGQCAMIDGNILDSVRALRALDGDDMK